MRPARALVDLDALRHNYRLAKALHGDRALAVVKANAYGHGALRCARVLEGEADGFAVAAIEEAIALRDGGITAPILLLEGVFEAAELAEVDARDLWMVVHHAEQLRMLDGYTPKKPFNVWLKLNTGMNRAGFAPGQARELHDRLLAGGKVGRVTLMTHFARADEPDADATEQQFARFQAGAAGIPAEHSICNSAAILGWPAVRGNWARPGIMLYGADPMPLDGGQLKPVMTLESRVIAVREIAAGEPLGYGARFVAERPTRVGLVAMGYADGYPRVVPSGTPVSIDGRPSRIIGRVSMDMLTVDLSALDEAGFDSRVEFWGAEVPINQVAAAAGTIAYELLCNVKRVRFEYRGS